VEKKNKYGKIVHLIHGDKGTFYPPELGKPYKDEFENIKPTAVLAHEIGGEMVLTYELASLAFQGLMITQITTLAASGYVSQKYSIKNTTTADKKVMLKMTYHAQFLSKQSIFAKGNQLLTNQDSTHTGAEAIEAKNFTENWIFEKGEAAGLCWPPDFKADVEWGAYISLEHDFQEIGAGKACETRAVELVYGTFESAFKFRDYVLEKYTPKQLPLKNFIELQTQDGNPVITTKRFQLSLLNHRNSILKGQFTLSAVNDLFKPQSQINTEDTVINKHDFNVELKQLPADGICQLILAANLKTHAITSQRAFFLPRGSVTCEVACDVLTVKNGKIAFKADATYSDGVFSLLYLEKGKAFEWLMHQHPQHLPNAHWNPFLGGVGLRPDELDERSFLTEQRTATFVEIRDNFNNLWTGIKIAVDVAECAAISGICYENYFVTLPGLPMLCHFSKIYNQTNTFKNFGFHAESFPSGSQNLAENKLIFQGKNQLERSLNLGIVQHYEHHESPLVTVLASRAEALYVYRNQSEASGSTIFSSNEFIQLYKHYQVKLAPKAVHTNAPMFMVLSKHQLAEEAFRELEKITF